MYSYDHVRKAPCGAVLYAQSHERNRVELFRAVGFFRNVHRSKCITHLYTHKTPTYPHTKAYTYTATAHRDIQANYLEQSRQKNALATITTVLVHIYHDQRAFKNQHRNYCAPAPRITAIWEELWGNDWCQRALSSTVKIVFIIVRAAEKLQGVAYRVAKTFRTIK